MSGTLTRPVVVLVGTPGAGKTSVGNALAARLAVRFRDTDADVESAAGMSVSDIFVQQGEAAFRELERQAVAVALAQHTGVLALGGGAILDPTTRRLLADHTVVWLTVGLSQAAERVGLSTARPLLLGNVRATLLRLMQGREPLYREVARFEVDTNDRTVEAIVEEIACELANGRSS